MSTLNQPPAAPPRSASKAALSEGMEETLPAPALVVEDFSGKKQQQAAEAEGAQSHRSESVFQNELIAIAEAMQGNDIPIGATDALSSVPGPVNDGLPDPVVPVIELTPHAGPTLRKIPSMEGLDLNNNAKVPSVVNVSDAPQLSSTTVAAPTIEAPDRVEGLRADSSTTINAPPPTSEIPNRVEGSKAKSDEEKKNDSNAPPPEAESAFSGMKTAPGVNPTEAKLQTEASKIPYTHSRAAAIKEKWKGLESPITGTPGTPENAKPTPESLSGTYRSAERSHKELEGRILPRIAHFMMTLDPFINIAGVTASGLTGWLIGTWHWSYVWMILLGICLALYVVKIRTTMSRAVDFERKRNEATLHLGEGVETAEWMNFFMAQLWPIIDPALFTAAIDTLEDQFVAQAPSFITRIHIADFELGPRAPRITSMQTYPRASGEDAVLMDLTIALHPSPQEIASRTRLNTHILIEIHLGHPKLGSVTVPIMVEEAGFEAQIRVWLKMTSTAPFVKTLKFTLLNKPQIDFAVRPLRMGNLMNLPILSNFIMTVIEKTVEDMVVSPHIIPLELDRMLMGDAAIADTRAIGIIKITFRGAKHLRAADWGGTSDPYATLSFGNSTKFLARTRVVPKDRHPIWNETHYCVITEDDVKNGWPLSVKVWDFDVMSRNDVLGMFEIKTEEVVDSEGVVYDGWKTLLRKNEKSEGKEDELARNGKLNFQIGFYPKCDGKDRKVDAEKYTSGILAINIHQALDIILRPKDRYGIYPSPYIRLYINDSPVFTTRIKHHNPSPVWATSSENFIRNWKNTVLRLVVKDARQHEHDPVIGVVIIKLGDLFEKSDDMFHSGWFELSGGIGFGRIRCSLAFRSVVLEEPENMKGFGVGEFEVRDLEVRGLDAIVKSDTPPSHVSIKIRSPLAEPPRVSTAIASTASFNPTYSEKYNLHINSRYQTALRFEVHQKGLFGFRDKVLAIGKMYLQDMVDNEERRVVLALKRWKRRGKEIEEGDSLGTTDKAVLRGVSGEEKEVQSQGVALDKKESERKEEGDAGDHMGDEHDSSRRFSDTSANWTDEEDNSDAASNYSDSDIDETGSINTADLESITSETTLPELHFTAIFRPGRNWISQPREGEDVEMDFLNPHGGGPSSSNHVTNTAVKGRGKVSSKLFTTPHPESGKEEEKEEMKGRKKGKEHMSMKEDKRLPGNKLTRTLEWSKDTVLEGVRGTRLWKRSGKKGVHGF